MDVQGFEEKHRAVYSGAARCHHRRIEKERSAAGALPDPAIR